MLTSFLADSLPAEYCTITSVPPAMGSHRPGASAKSDNTAGKLPGATSSYSAGWALIWQHRRAQLQRRLRQSACTRCNGKDFPQALHGSLARWAAIFWLISERPRGPCLACKFRIAPRRTPEKPVAELATRVQRLDLR